MAASGKPCFEGYSCIDQRMVRTQDDVDVPWQRAVNRALKAIDALISVYGSYTR